MKLARGDTIVAFDPGSIIAGYAVLKAKVPGALLPNDFRIIEVGVIKLPKNKDLSIRIYQLHAAALKIIESYQPKLCALEKAFFGVNPSSALKLGEARGALIAAAGRMQAKIIEVSPTKIKQVITGNGRASKLEVAMALEAITGFDRGKLAYDATDALGLALAAIISQTVIPSQRNVTWEQAIRSKDIKPIQE